MHLVPAVIVVVLARSAPACPYDETLAVAHAAAANVADDVAAHPAHGADLLGGNSAYATGLMARRVISDGRDWSFTGQIVPGENDLGSHVAVPFRVAANDGAWLVATELLENLVDGGHGSATLKLAGRSFKGEDGVLYVVLTSYKVINS